MAFSCRAVLFDVGRGKRSSPSIKLIVWWTATAFWGPVSP